MYTTIYLEAAYGPGFDAHTSVCTIMHSIPTILHHSALHLHASTVGRKAVDFICDDYKSLCTNNCDGHLPSRLVYTEINLSCNNLHEINLYIV